MEIRQSPKPAFGTISLSPIKTTTTKLTALPVEILSIVYAYSLNPSLCYVNRHCWTHLSSNASRLQFCVKALGPTIKGEMSSVQAARLQNYILRSDWFSLDFAEKFERAFSREYGGPRVVEEEEGPLSITIVKDVYIPGRLMRGGWTEERVDLLERLFCWGVRILSVPPILDKIPERLLCSAISEGNLHAVELFRRWTGVGFTHEMFRLAVVSGCKEDVVRAMVVDHFHKNYFIEWGDRRLRDWAEARMWEGDPKGRWLVKILDSNGWSVWRKVLEDDEAKRKNS